MAIAETKLNKFFESHLYEKQNYKMFQRDRVFIGNFRGGIFYVNSSIPPDRKSEYECKDCDSIIVELNIGKVRWLYIAVYNAPSQLLTGYLDEIENILNNALYKYECIIIAGDTNTDLLKITTESRDIIHFYDNFDLRNIIKEPTCFVQNSKTLIGLILTNKPKSILAKNALDTGISDVHRIVLPG